ncbi:MAG: tetratricopeptide repeat protein [Mycobacterium sp.]|nr:tetratricopeptide repeat protein [Mycobacterium sp.]
MTRPRPRIAPVMTGAVDLSGLKQRAAGGAGGAQSGQHSVEITETNFETEVLVRSGAVPVVVLLWSPRSQTCLTLLDGLDALATADAGKWCLATVNVDAVPRVGAIFGVEAVPTVVALAGGQPLASFEGAQPPEQLRRWIDSLLSATSGKLAGGGDVEQPVDPALNAARDKLDSGDFVAAAAAYQAILDGDPAHAEAKGALRQIAFLQRASAHPTTVLAAADAAPDDIDAAFAAADVQVLAQDPAGAFDRLITLLKRSTGEDRTRVRTRLIELFELFDPADPDVVAGRRNLANALY